jgi:hypothetical protein
MKEFKTTARGFKIYGELKDGRGCGIKVQESSAVGSPQVYVWCHNDAGAYHTTPKDGDVPMHINVEQAKQLIDILEDFVDDAESEDNWRNDPEYIKVWGDE